MSFFSWIFQRKTPALEPPPEFLEPDPPDWLLELNGLSVSARRNFSIRAPIWREKRVGRAEIILLPIDPQSEPGRAGAELDRIDLDRLLVLLGFSFPGDIADAAGAEDTGLPVRLTIFRHQPLESRSARCNLANWLQIRQTAPPPGIELSKILFLAANRMLPIPHI